MKLSGLVIGFALVVTAACSKDKPSTTPAEDKMVDPTVPSWAPKSCLAYHAAVVRFVGCEQMDAADRETTKANYEAESKSWQEMSNLPQGAIADVDVKCTAEGKAVRAKVDPSCPGTTTKPTP